MEKLNENRVKGLFKKAPVNDFNLKKESEVVYEKSKTKRV